MDVEFVEQSIDATAQTFIIAGNGEFSGDGRFNFEYSVIADLIQFEFYILYIFCILIPCRIYDLHVFSSTSQFAFLLFSFALQKLSSLM